MFADIAQTVRPAVDRPAIVQTQEECTRWRATISPRYATIVIAGRVVTVSRNAVTYRDVGVVTVPADAE